MIRMGVLRQSVVAQGSRLSRVWHTDITDPTEMAQLRARVLMWSALLGLLAEVGGGLATTSGAQSDWAVQVGITAYLVALTAWTVRGARVGDREFLALMLISHTFAAVSVALGIGLGKVSDTGLSLVTVALMAAMFCGRRSHVALQAAFASSLLVVSALLGDAGSHTPQEVSTGAFDLVLISAVVRLLRDVAVAGVRRARLGEVTDPLTGLANRRGMEQLGGRAWVQRARDRGSLAMLVIDVDHFKQINDSQGHAAGDDVLRRLAEVLSTSLRADDVAVRLGGEEFLLLCSVPPGDAEAIAERLRATVEQQLGITVSIGVHQVAPVATDVLPTTLWSAVDVADRALDVATTSGRYRVVRAGAA